MFGRTPTPDQPEDRSTEQTPERRKKSLEEWHSLVMERIEEAIERGDFDNLPGKGKPLDLRENPNEPAEMRMANRLLKNNELAPAWIMDRKTLIYECDLLRHDLERQWRWYMEVAAQPPTPEEWVELAAEWAHLIQAWEKQIAELNRRILNLNLTLPIWRMELMRLNLDRELKRIGARRQLIEE
jgi:DnaJ homolog subfamily C member 28